MAYTLDPEQQEVRALHTLVDFTDKDVLEPGCADGRMTWRFADRAASVLGLDPAAAAIETAQRQALADGRGNVTFRVGDLFTTALPAAAFDVVLFSGSL